MVEFNLSELSPRKDADIDLVWLLCKEGWQKARLGDYHAQRQALSRFTIGALLLSEPVLRVLRRELRRAAPDARIEESEIQNVLLTEVLRRDVLEGEKAETAKRRIARAANRSLRSSSSEETSDSTEG